MLPAIKELLQQISFGLSGSICSIHFNSKNLESLAQTCATVEKRYITFGRQTLKSRMTLSFWSQILTSHGSPNPKRTIQRNYYMLPWWYSAIKGTVLWRFCHRRMRPPRPRFSRFTPAKRFSFLLMQSAGQLERSSRYSHPVGALVELHHQPHHQRLDSPLSGKFWYCPFSPFRFRTRKCTIWMRGGENRHQDIWVGVACRMCFFFGALRFVTLQQDSSLGLTQCPCFIAAETLRVVSRLQSRRRFANPNPTPFLLHFRAFPPSAAHVRRVHHVHGGH